MFVCLFVFNVPPKAKVMGPLGGDWDHGLKPNPTDRRSRESAPGLQNEWFIHITVAPPDGSGWTDALIKAGLAKSHSNN